MTFQKKVWRKNEYKRITAKSYFWDGKMPKKVGWRRCGNVKVQGRRFYEHKKEHVFYLIVADRWCIVKGIKRKFFWEQGVSVSEEGVISEYRAR